MKLTRFCHLIVFDADGQSVGHSTIRPKVDVRNRSADWMRLGLIADIHERGALLRAALHRFGQERVDQVVATTSISKSSGVRTWSRLNWPRWHPKISTLANPAVFSSQRNSGGV